MRKFLAVILAALFMAASQSAWSAVLPDFAELAAKCGPAVVNINTERKASGDGGDDFFGEMFRNMPPGFEKFSNSLARIQAIGGNRTAGQCRNKNLLVRDFLSLPMVT